MKKISFVVAAALVVLLAGGCSYDPVPEGCRFQLYRITRFEIAGVSLSNYGRDTLSIQHDSIIVASIESGVCPVEFIQNVSIQNMSTQSSVSLEEFNWSSQISAGGKQYSVDSGAINRRMIIEASKTELVRTKVVFDAVEVWGKDLSATEIRDLCLELSFNSNGGVRDDLHLGRLLITADIEQDTDHGRISSAQVPIGLSWILPD
jgi:hypothetical protein